MRIAFLWGVWQPPLDTCANALAEDGNDVLAVAEYRDDRSPFETDRWRNSYHKINADDAYDSMVASLRRFEADVWLCSGWHRPWIRELIRDASDSRVRKIVCFDNQFRGDSRQVVGRALARWKVHRYFDGAFVPGDRQAQFASYLGFPNSRIATGLFIPDPRLDSAGASPTRHQFLYLGAREERKGFPAMIRAYFSYADRSTNPWGLVLGGTGVPVDHQLVTDLGFVSSVEDVRKAFGMASASLMVGGNEAWGIFLQEAAIAGHALIASREVGASPHLVDHGLNGYVVGASDESSLTRAMVELTSRTDSEIEKMGFHSRQNATKYQYSSWLSSLQSLL